ncbi:unnamed protein product [Echinostoma caproni]|uniref:Hydrolase n=1 Tax=Echinostoma caproni TaxID=27848 RepID=A0A183AYT6_9TREM|nr:unnamed protein product [Echinostoma caproni]
MENIQRRSEHDVPLEQYCLFVHGGMDTEGQMFSDAWLIVLGEKIPTNNVSGRLTWRLIESSSRLPLGE